MAASSLDVVAGRGSAVLPVLGDPVPEPVNWPFEVDAAATGSLAPVPLAEQRVAVLWATTSFTLTTADQGFAVLELRMKFEDGVRAWLNGALVVSEALATSSSTVGLADRPHGPEWQTFYVPVGPHTLQLGPNTLAIEVHPSGRRLAPNLAVEVVARRDVGILRGPRIAALGETAATIVVDTDPNVRAELAWNVVGSAVVTKVASPAGSHHVFALAKLPARAQIEYRVVAGGSITPARRFHTMPSAGDVVRIGVYGDVRGGHAVHRKIVEQMLGEGLDLVAVTGDMVLRGTDEADWQKFYAVTSDLVAQVPYLPAVGNHDLGWNATDDPARATDRLALPPGPAGRPVGNYWYAVDVAGVHLVFLDSNAYEVLDQEAWLERDLAAARKAKTRAIFVFTHDGPYSRGLHRGNALARARYVPILVKWKVDMLFSGHDHMYQRGELGGLKYMVSGGGGAPLYAQTCGVSGKKACVEDGSAVVLKEHHYATVVVEKGGAIEVCPRKPDGTRLEKCVRWKP